MPDYELVNISEIISALGVIKHECEIHPSCTDCPLCIKDYCGIKHKDPQDWNIASNYIWRAFR